MDKEEPRRALLLGLVEVRQPLEQLDMEGRSRLYTLCHGASVAGEKDEANWLGWQEHGLMGVEVTLDQDHLHVTSNDVMVSRHSLADVGAIVAMPGTEGHLVVVGKCQVKGLLLAVILDMMSQKDARRLIEDLRERMSRLAPPSVQPAAPQDTACRTPLPSAPPMTKMDPFTDFPHTCSTNTTPHPSQPTVQHLPSPGSTTTLSPKILLSPIPVKQPSSSSSDPVVRPPLPVKTLVANEPFHAPRLVAPVRFTFLPPVSCVPKPPASTPPASKPPVSTPPVPLRDPSTRPVLSRPLCTPPAPPVSPSNPPSSTPPVPNLPVSTPPVSIPSVSTPPVSTPSVSTPSVFIQPVPTPPVCTPPVSNRLASNQPATSQPASIMSASTSPVSTPSASASLVPTPKVPTQAAFTRSMSKPALPTRPVAPLTVTSRQFSLLRVPTPLLSTLPEPSMSASTNPTVSSSSEFTPAAPTPLVSSPRVKAPLVITTTVLNKTVAITTVCTPSVATQPTITRPASKPAVAPRPVSFPKALSSPAPTTTVSITALPTTPVSTTQLSTVPVSSTPIFTTSGPTTLISTTPVASQDPRRHSVVSSSSLEEDNLNGSGKAELILGTLNVDESEYLFIPGMKKMQEEDSLSSSSTSSSLEHELSAFLENELRYLDTLKRIQDARKAVKSELQNLLRSIESLVDFHENFFKDLHQEFPSCAGFAQLFLSRKEDLDQYCYYLMNAPKVIHQLGKQTEEVKRQHPSLEADLKSSWKRLHYYFMTFDKLIKVVSDEEQPLVREVADLLRNMNRQGDSAILIDAVSGAPFCLHTSGSLLLHGLFTIKDFSGALTTKGKYHVLLFKEQIVITRPKKERYQYKDCLPIRQVNLREANDDEATFVLDFVQGGNKKNKRFAFKSRQKEVRDAWVQEITRLHLEYAKKVKSHSKLRYSWHTVRISV